MATRRHVLCVVVDGGGCDNDQGAYIVRIHALGGMPDVTCRGLADGAAVV